MTPMPPSRASAIAMRASVTVSIAAEQIGIASSMPRGEARAGRDLVRKHRRLGRNEQDVVERQTFLGESLTEREEPLDLLTTELDAHARPWPATASARQSRAPPGDDAERLTRTPRKHETQAPRGDLGSTVPALASALNV